MKKETRVEMIKRMCAEKNISVSYMLRKAGLSSNTLNNWETAEPKSFRMYDAMLEVIEKEPVAVEA